MGAQQFGRTVENTSYAENVEVDIQRNTANQFDGDEIGADLSAEDYSTGEQNISGAEELTILAKEKSGNSSTVTVEWTDGAGNVIGTETPEALKGLTSTSDFANLIVKSTHFNLKASGASTDYNITVNAH
jgi:hypothetical protein